MVKVHLMKSNGIQSALPTEGISATLSFKLSSKYEGVVINAKLSATGDSLESSCLLEIQPEEAKILSEIPPEKFTEKERQKVSELFTTLLSSNQRVLNIIIQELELNEPRCLTSGLNQWSFDGKTWSDFPLRSFLTGISIHQSHNLDEEWSEHIQTILDMNEEPFIAFQHLHEAQRRRGKRFTWIEATIAAELAIKEALSRLEPKLSTLLFEVPSPPLRKLYGPILESVAGERSPYITELAKGSEIRNKLVHKPEEVKLDLQEVVDYVSIVNRTIWHLVGLCRRNVSSNKIHKLSILRCHRDRP